MSIAFYISGHGFGHASRQVEIINRLGDRHRIVIRSAVNARFLSRTLRVPSQILAGPCDTGIVQTSSIAHDDDATILAAQEFYAAYDQRVGADVERIRDSGVELVVSDIAPLGISVAASLGVPGVAIANFTWDWIYETHPGFRERAPEVLGTIRAAYGRASLALELPFGAGFEVFPMVRRVPLVARHPTKSRAETRAHFGLPPHGNVVLLSFGGYGMPALNLHDADCRPDWTIVTTDRTTPGGADGAVVLPESAFESDVRYEDLVAAVDAVMTKPGYGIIAECISAGTPMVYTSRGAFREYDLLVGEMPRVLRCAFISPGDLVAGRWRGALEAVRSQPPPPEGMAVNGAEVVAGILDELI